MDGGAGSTFMPDGTADLVEARAPIRAKPAAELGQKLRLSAAKAERLWKPEPPISAEPAYQAFGRRSPAEKALLRQKPTFQIHQP